MDILSLLDALRSDYLSRFEVAYQQQSGIYEQVTTEIAFEISKGPYKRLYVIDLLGKDGEALSAVEVATDEDSYLGGLSLQYKALSVEFDCVSWEAMRFSFRPVPERLTGFEAWFDKWIDLEAIRRIDGQVFSNVIHFAWLESGLLDVDFGSAPTDAVIELLDLFQTSGVKSVLVSSGKEWEDTRNCSSSGALPDR
ncbi:MAG: hypothetical protein N4A70_19085 [Pelagimonas sp.]|jgi:hypothetical protein|nr:hypothetical protein [Pelagimonas sp.]